MESEIWAIIPGSYTYTYEASTLGRIRKQAHLSERRDGTVLHYRAKYIKPRIDSDGYPSVVIRGSNGKEHTVVVHRLVALAFLGVPPIGEEVRHRDGNRQNAHLDNLLYGTRSQNVFDSIDHGTHVQARKTHCIQGHVFDALNTYYKPSRPRSRICRVCMLAKRQQQKEHPAWAREIAVQIRQAD